MDRTTVTETPGIMDYIKGSSAAACEPDVGRRGGDPASECGGDRSEGSQVSSCSGCTPDSGRQFQLDVPGGASRDCALSNIPNAAPSSGELRWPHGAIGVRRGALESAESAETAEIVAD